LSSVRRGLAAGYDSSMDRSCRWRRSLIDQRRRGSNSEATWQCLCARFCIRLRPDLRARLDSLCVNTLCRALCSYLSEGNKDRLRSLQCAACDCVCFHADWLDCNSDSARQNEHRNIVGPISRTCCKCSSGGAGLTTVKAKLHY